LRWTTSAAAGLRQDQLDVERHAVVTSLQAQERCRADATFTIHARLLRGMANPQYERQQDHHAQEARGDQGSIDWV